MTSRTGTGDATTSGSEPACGAAVAHAPCFAGSLVARWWLARCLRETPQLTKGCHGQSRRGSRPVAPTDVDSDGLPVRPAVVMADGRGSGRSASVSSTARSTTPTGRGLLRSPRLEQLETAAHQHSESAALAFGSHSLAGRCRGLSVDGVLDLGDVRTVPETLVERHVLVDTDQAEALTAGSLEVEVRIRHVESRHEAGLEDSAARQRTKSRSGSALVISPPRMSQ